MKGRGSGGVLLIIAGVWVLSQVLAGDALKRLGLIGGDESAPDEPDGFGPGFRDKNGRPL